MGEIESGLHKMMLIGLGKHEGAKIYHRAIQDHSDLATVTERGVAIAGAMNTRGPLDEIDGMATEVVAEEFYGKSLRLRHE